MSVLEMCVLKMCVQAVPLLLLLGRREVVADWS